MKTIYHLFSCIFFFSSYCNSQELCSDLFLFDTNTQFEMRAYGATDNLVAITHYDVENIIETEDEKKVILSSFNTDSKNLEGSIGNAEYEIACKQNSLVFHHRNNDNIGRMNGADAPHHSPHHRHHTLLLFSRIGKCFSIALLPATSVSIRECIHCQRVGACRRGETMVAVVAPPRPRLFLQHY